MPETQRQILQMLVYEVVKQIPQGKVATYGQIAKAIGLPRHARHVGFALNKLESDSQVPWHRVVNAKGETHRKHAGKPSQQRLRLENEGINFNEKGRISLKLYQCSDSCLTEK